MGRRSLLNISAAQPYLSHTRHIFMDAFPFPTDPRRTVVTPSEVGSPEDKSRFGEGWGIQEENNELLFWILEVTV